MDNSGGLVVLGGCWCEHCPGIDYIITLITYTLTQNQLSSSKYHERLPFNKFRLGHSCFTVGMSVSSVVSECKLSHATWIDLVEQLMVSKASV